MSSPPSPQPSELCAILDEFLLTIKGVSESPAFKNAEVLTGSFKQLTAKIKSQEETMMATRHELMRTRQELDRSSERLLRAHREESHKVTTERNESQADCARLQAELTQEKARSDGLAQEIKDLQQKISEEAEQTQKLRDQIATLAQDNAKLESDLGTANESLRVRNDEVEEHKAKIEEQDKLQSELTEKNSDLNTKLQESTVVIERINNLAPPSTKDDAEQLNQSMNHYWQVLFEAVTKCFDTDIALPVLEDQQPWKALKEAEMIPADLPFPPSNATSAKRIRTAAVMAVIAELLVEHIFTPCYLFFDDEEFRNVSFDLAMTDSDREKFLRRVLNNVSKDKHTAVMADRNELVLKRVTTCVQPLLDEEIRESLRTTLSKVLSEATEFWSSVQRMDSQFDTDVAFDASMKGQWRSIGWTEESEGFIEREITDEELQSLDPCLVLFPRVFIVTDSADQPVFPGIVLPRSETIAAKKEWDKIRQSRPMLGRPSTRRSSRPRRMTLTGSEDERRAFLGHTRSRSSYRS